MTRVVVAVLGLLVLAGGARAQGLNDLGRVLQDQVLGGGRQDPNRERDAYERGRQDQAEQIRRERDLRANDDRRRFEDDRRRPDGDRRRQDFDRQRDDEQRGRDPARRY